MPKPGRKCSSLGGNYTQTNLITTIQSAFTCFTRNEASFLRLIATKSYVASNAPTVQPSEEEGNLGTRHTPC